MSASEGTGLYPARFELLDAFRGLAALAVVVHHVVGVHIGGPAVMVFFVISGYCIAAAADSGERAGLGLGGFLWRRARRIFPPYLLAVAFWAATRAIKAAGGGGNDLVRPVGEWVQNLTLTQWLTLVPAPADYPASNPALFVHAFWSLCYEEQFYLVMGVAMVWAARARVAIVLGLLALGIAWNIVHPKGVHGVFVEYWAPFALGCVVYYRQCRWTEPRLRRAADVFLVLFSLAAAWWLWREGGFPAPKANGDEYRSVPGEWLASGVFALLLVALRPLDRAIMSHAATRPLRWLGAITFSLYLTHQFNLQISNKAARVLAGWTGLGWGVMLVQIGVLVAIGAAFWWACERPFLNRPLRATARG